MPHKHQKEIYMNIKNEPSLSTPDSKKSDIDVMTRQVIRQINAYQQLGTKKWDYKVALTDLPVQVGSLTKLAMQLHGERYSHGLSPTIIKERISDELADILSLVLFIASELSIDIKQSWDAMINSDNEKIEERVHHPT